MIPLSRSSKPRSPELKSPKRRRNTWPPFAEQWPTRSWNRSGILLESPGNQRPQDIPERKRLPLQSPWSRTIRWNVEERPLQRARTGRRAREEKETQRRPKKRSQARTRRYTKGRITIAIRRKATREKRSTKKRKRKRKGGKAKERREGRGVKYKGVFRIHINSCNDFKAEAPSAALAVRNDRVTACWTVSAN